MERNEPLISRTFKELVERLKNLKSLLKRLLSCNRCVYNSLGHASVK